MKRKRQEQEVMRATSFRCSNDQRAKFIRLGGGAWLRSMLDKTPMPAPKR